MGTIQNVKDQWNANLYDCNHSFVSNYGADVVELLAPKKDEKILDLGCGTGDLAKKLYDMGIQVMGVDNSANMVNQAKGKYPEIKFHIHDVLDLPYKDEFDAVFSNAVLHWIKEPKEALKNIYKSLRKGGRFVAELGGKGNVQMITDEVRKQFQKIGLAFDEEKFPWYFPSIGEYTSLMEEVGFQVLFAYHFDRPTELEGDDGLKNWLEMFGALMFSGLEEETKLSIIKNAEFNLKDIMFENGNWIADYKRLRIVGIKK
ncbi:MAG TPA: methyltransferase domain-containing protein [Bacillus bacterium]|nr:methyltransferase domain-containing protein [Bacillus sp. (in: firmicutes)]